MIPQRRFAKSDLILSCLLRSHDSYHRFCIKTISRNHAFWNIKRREKEKPRTMMWCTKCDITRITKPIKICFYRVTHMIANHVCVSAGYICICVPVYMWFLHSDDSKQLLNCVLEHSTSWTILRERMTMPGEEMHLLHLVDDCTYHTQKIINSSVKDSSMGYKK